MSFHAELHGHYIEDLNVGMTEIYSKTVTDSDIVLYSGVSGDTNPLHLDDDFAKETIFKGRIAHGMLSAGLISAIFGTKLPGPGAIYVSQSLRFKAPVRSGDTVVARVTVTDVAAEKKRVTFECSCHVGTRLVLEGDAVLMVPSRDGA
ncbi:MaoC family dehydratase [Oceanibacterium hippocampi]|uniref:(R)-specific enoyl-CoA hydratase n=1 Tax=Oceanibacterium hippocampi TaxID=745714 RepID=A0A1Y5S6R5_9PROT|nr:MaoC family dehydratase [Oceanibacterium hippocampi]SLN32832.1 (R)-specific enoyl-CoA hydratase [Oceanibacterium hippocampi]